jgi:pyrimidine 5'-nucleotidase
MVKLVFDLDGTLYSYSQTGIAEAMRRLIRGFVKRFFNTTDEDAEARQAAYYKKYGLTGRGLAKEHGVDMQEYCAYVHSFDVAALMGRDLRLREALLRTAVTLGATDMWIFTNATAAHARNCLAVLGIVDLFTDVTTGELRIVDCFEQWAVGAEKEFECKPAHAAYNHTAKRVGAADGERVIFFEDSAANLVTAKELGWTTVYITDGRVPNDKEKQTWDFVSSNIYDALSDVTAAAARWGASKDATTGASVDATAPVAVVAPPQSPAFAPNPVADFLRTMEAQQTTTTTNNAEPETTTTRAEPAGSSAFDAPAAEEEIPIVVKPALQTGAAAPARPASSWLLAHQMPVHCAAVGVAIVAGAFALGRRTAAVA